jgi:hypothetical protein
MSLPFVHASGVGRSLNSARERVSPMLLGEPPVMDIPADDGILPRTIETSRP